MIRASVSPLPLLPPPSAVLKNTRFCERSHRGYFPYIDIPLLRSFHVSIRFETHVYTRVHAQIRTHARTYTSVVTFSPIAVAFADTHVAFCNETVQITAARTAMHVIMNAGRLFVSVPSAGNIGHFEFSIFNALVSPSSGPSSLVGVPPPPASALLFPAIPVAVLPPSSTSSRAHVSVSLGENCNLRGNYPRFDGKS